MSREFIDDLKTKLRVNTDKELAIKLGVSRNAIATWKRGSFNPSNIVMDMIKIKIKEESNNYMREKIHG